MENRTTSIRRKIKTIKKELKQRLLFEQEKCEKNRRNKKNMIDYDTKNKIKKYMNKLIKKRINNINEVRERRVT